MPGAVAWAGIPAGREWLSPSMFAIDRDELLDNMGRAVVASSALPIEAVWR